MRKGREKVKLEEFFKSKGYDIKEIIEYQNKNSEYLSWYKGFVENFHRYYVYNGERKVYKNRYSLGLAKKVCENFADFLMNEKVKITLGKDKDTKILNEILENNNFWVKANQGIEKSFAFGTGCFLLSEDIKLKIKIQFINAYNMYPLTYDSDTISECAFINDSFKYSVERNRTEKIKNIQLHTLEAGEYVIRNYRFIEEANGNLIEIELEDIPSEIYTNSENRWFIPIKPNIINNIDLNSPFGIPIYANSIDVLKALDLTYDSLVNEIQNGRKRLFVTQEAMKVGGDGCFKNAFDPQDVLFYILDSNFNENKQSYVQEVNGELRIAELKNALQTNLDLLSMKVGLGDKYFKFDGTQITRTATEVISENSDLFRTIVKHETLLESALQELIRNIIEIGNAEKIFKISPNIINIKFDDSIIESKEQEKAQDRQDMTMEVMSRKEYREKWYGEDEETAKQKIKEIDNEKQEISNLNFMEGEIS